MVQLATWTIGTLTGKSMDLVDTMKIKGRVNVTCSDETKQKRIKLPKWKRDKLRNSQIATISTTRKNNGIKRVGIVVDKDLKKIVGLQRLGGRFIVI